MMMMTSAKRKIAAVLAAVSVMTVASGALADYGDADKDKGDESRYKVGDEVEVYKTAFHVGTRRGKIIQAGKSPSGVWEYIVDYGANRNRRILKNVDADEIESD